MTNRPSRHRNQIASYVESDEELSPRRFRSSASRLRKRGEKRKRNVENLADALSYSEEDQGIVDTRRSRTRRWDSSSSRRSQRPIKSLSQLSSTLQKTEPSGVPIIPSMSSISRERRLPARSTRYNDTFSERAIIDKNLMAFKRATRKDRASKVSQIERREDPIINHRYSTRRKGALEIASEDDIEYIEKKFAELEKTKQVKTDDFELDNSHSEEDMLIESVDDQSHASGFKIILQKTDSGVWTLRSNNYSSIMELEDIESNDEDEMESESEENCDQDDGSPLKRNKKSQWSSLRRKPPISDNSNEEQVDDEKMPSSDNESSHSEDPELDIPDSESSEESSSNSLVPDESFSVGRYSLRNRRPPPQLQNSSLRRIRKQSSSRWALRSRSNVNYNEFSQHDKRQNRKRHDRIIHRYNSDASNSESLSETAISPVRRRPSGSESMLPMNWDELENFGTEPSSVDKTTKLLADVNPVNIDKSVDWSCVGGLEGHIRGLKEMIILPLLYPEIFEKFHVTPPKGVLFFGPPGTGKTLTARALANTCSSVGKKVAFFMRKGADCLSKWVGEAERQLRLLFEEAAKNQPSIIFFDEIDGLAPVRSSKQDQIHSSIVSTLLALMDGIDNRGQIIVIGATNRVDAIDPALRRPGRFDRELCFALPSKKARRQILGIHTKKWYPAPSDGLLDQVAEDCAGYCGADLRALCTEAALNAIRRRYPEIYDSSTRLAVDIDSICVEPIDFRISLSKIVPASHRSSTVFAQILPKHLNALLCETLFELSEKTKEIFPLNAKTKSMVANEIELSSSVGISPLRPRILIYASGNRGQIPLCQALLHNLEEFPVYSVDFPTILSDSISKGPEESVIRIVNEARRNSPSIIFWPHIDSWWDTASECLQTLVLSLLNDIPISTPVFLVASADVVSDPESDLPVEVHSLFNSKVCIQFFIREFNLDRRKSFFSVLADDVKNYINEIEISRKNGNKQVNEHKEDIQKLPVENVPNTVDDQTISPSRNEETSSDPDEVYLLKMRMRLRALCNKLIQDFRSLREPPEFIADSSSDASNSFLFGILRKIEDRKCRTPTEFLMLIDNLVNVIRNSFTENDARSQSMISCVGAMQDLALSAVYTFPKVLVQKCEKIVPQEPVTEIINEDGFPDSIDNEQNALFEEKDLHNSDANHPSSHSDVEVSSNSPFKNPNAMSLDSNEFCVSHENIPSNDVAHLTLESEVIDENVEDIRAELCDKLDSSGLAENKADGIKEQSVEFHPVFSNFAFDELLRSLEKIVDILSQSSENYLLDQMESLYFKSSRMILNYLSTLIPNDETALSIETFDSEEFLRRTSFLE